MPSHLWYGSNIISSVTRVAGPKRRPGSFGQTGPGGREGDGSWWERDQLPSPGSLDVHPKPPGQHGPGVRAVLSPTRVGGLGYSNITSLFRRCNGPERFG